MAMPLDKYRSWLWLCFLFLAYRVLILIKRILFLNFNRGAKYMSCPSIILNRGAIAPLPPHFPRAWYSVLYCCYYISFRFLSCWSDLYTCGEQVYSFLTSPYLYQHPYRYPGRILIGLAGQTFAILDSLGRGKLGEPNNWHPDGGAWEERN